MCGQVLYRYIHRLVAAAFIGCVDNKTVNHKNFDKTDNRLENLEIISMRENYDHAVKGDRYRRGEDYGGAVLTEDNVRDIRKMAQSGNYTQRQIAENFGVYQSHISLIIRGKIWTHVI